jgi:hypothetical protein
MMYFWGVRVGSTNGSVDVESSNVLPSPLKADFSKPNPTIGIKEIEWSPKGDYMAIRNGMCKQKHCLLERFESSSRSAVEERY